MKAWRVHEHGRFQDVLTWEECEAPLLPSTGVLIQVAAAGVGFDDILAIAGTDRFRGPLPFIPGHEAAGVVTEAGPESSYLPGDRVVAVGIAGAFAELVAAPDAHVFPIPDSMPDDHAAGFVVAYQTSYFALAERAKLTSGETLLVHGGAGSVGSAAIQLGRSRGATVIATARGSEKLALCTELGAHHVIDSEESDFAGEVLRLTGGAGADVIYDPVGGDIFDRSPACIAFGGRLLSVGFVSGRAPELSVKVVMEKNLSVIGVNWSTYQFHAPALIRKTHAQLCELYVNGIIAPPIRERLALSALPDALAKIESHESVGKVVCVVGAA